MSDDTAGMSMNEYRDHVRKNRDDSKHTPSHKGIKKLQGDLDKKWPGQAMMATDIPVGEPISTGSLALDFATGFGGFPNNRVVEVYGKEGVGKTTLALLTMVNALEKYPERGALFLDLEHKVTPEWMEMIVGRELMETRII
jgi:RecA/RadA recombinase